MSTLQEVKRDDNISEEYGFKLISDSLWRLGCSVKGRSIRISRARNPLGNKAWGMIEYLQKNGFILQDFTEYQKEMFGADGYKFYPHKRRFAA